MSKYTEELKKQIVLEHKIKHYGARVLQRKYGIPRSLIRQWIAQYELNGKFTEPTRHFSGEFKLKVLNYQQEHHLYYRWYRSSVSETRQAFKNAKEKFNTEQTKRRMDKR